MSKVNKVSSGIDSLAFFPTRRCVSLRGIPVPGFLKVILSFNKTSPALILDKETAETWYFFRVIHSVEDTCFFPFPWINPFMSHLY